MTEKQLAFVQMEAKFLGDHEGKRHWWTSGTDVGVDGVWMWATSYTPVEEFMWDKGYPVSSRDRNCMMLNHDHQFLGYNYACEHCSLFTEQDTVVHPICQKK